MSRDEAPPGKPELIQISRRSYLGAMGASMSLSLGACIRKPKEKILPYARRPEDLIPGHPRYFATSAVVGGSVLGLLVESQDGRPTKVEGNPQHPYSGGATNAWAQASVLDLYSPQRSQKPVKSGGSNAEWNWKAALWQEADRFLAEHVRRSEGLALLIGETRSPTLLAQFDELKRQCPSVRFFRHDAAHPANALAGAAISGVQDTLPLPAIDRAEVIVALDCDFLGIEGDAVRHAGHFADGRRVTSPASTMNRLYVVEPVFSITGAKADHRLQIRGSEIGTFLGALAKELFGSGLTPAPGAGPAVSKLGFSGHGFGKWVTALAKDLARHRGTSLIVVGERQPPWVHALANLLNASLGNVGKTAIFARHPGPAAGTISELAVAIGKKEIDTLVMLGGNPAYDAPADLEFAKLIGQVPVSVHHGMVHNETSRLVTWHIPASHYLESWADLEASDGTTGIQQPLIAPLFDTISEIELLARMLDPARAGAARSGYEIVRAHWSARTAFADFEAGWRRWLHDGVIPGTAGSRSITPSFSWSKLAAALPALRPEAAAGGGVELVFQLDPSVYDGRYAGNPWLQELPDPIHKLTWDNAALVGPATAAAHDLGSGDMVEIQHAGRRLAIAVFVTPGVAKDTVVLPLGYGRSMAISGLASGHPLAGGGGFNTYALRGSHALHIASGAAMTKIDGHYQLASTQDYGSLTPTTHHAPGLVTEAQKQGFEPRPIIRETTLDGYRAEPRFVDRDEVIAKEEIKSLYTEPHPWKQPHGQPGAPPLPQQWGMSIDLGSCTGCNACMAACQAENNIPVVGKERVMDGRILSWIRLDRYYSGSADEPRVSMQPMLCQQCENAPCETVCPVNATAHSPEGLNDMAYNRCIGTRYCSNNCPYKVRRFNFFNFNQENDEAMPLLSMQRNPDVTVRFRGVMEKCTFCVQRINQAKIVAKVTATTAGDGRVADGTIVPACGQACPTKAIVFGDLSDPGSRVSALKRLDRDYTVLAELNTKPRTSYLAGLRNPNPDLV